VFLHEPIAWTMVASTIAVIMCVAGAKYFARSPETDAMPSRPAH